VRVIEVLILPFWWEITKLYWIFPFNSFLQGFHDNEKLNLHCWCHTPIFDLKSYIHIPSDLEYYLTFQSKNLTERYFKIPHFCSDSGPLLSLFLFLISFYFLLFYFSFIANTFFNMSKITCPCPKFEFQPRLNYRANVNFVSFLSHFAKRFPTLNCIHHHLIHFN